jgi:acyl carrier protein
MDYQTELNEIFRRVFREPTLVVRPEMNANDVEGWTSITHAEMIMEVEKHLGVKFKLREVTKWRNVQDMVESIRAQKG